MWRWAYRQMLNRFRRVLKVRKFRSLNRPVLHLPLAPLPVIGPHGGVVIHRSALDVPISDDIGGPVVHRTEAGLHQADIGAAAIMKHAQWREITVDIVAGEIAH